MERDPEDSRTASLPQPHEKSPGHLRYLVGMLRRSDRSERHLLVTEALHFMTACYASAAAALWRHSGVEWKGALPLSDEERRRLLRNALTALAGQTCADDLLAVFSKGRHCEWLALQGADTLDEEAALADWLEASEVFFDKWIIEGSSDPAVQETVLRGPGMELDLFPLLQIADCPDCDDPAQTFVMTGILPGGRVLYHNVHSGHSVTLPHSRRVEDAPPKGASFPLTDFHRDFDDDDEKAEPRIVLAQIRRVVTENDRGYVLIYGASGTGKTWIGRFIASDDHLAGLDVHVAFSAVEHIGLPPSLWIAELDAALRREPGTCRLPAPEYAHAIAAAAGPPELQLRAYLSGLKSLNDGPVVIVVDDIHLRPESAPYWPAILPDGVFVVLTAAPGVGSEHMRARLNALFESGARELRLTAGEPLHMEMVEQWRARTGSVRLEFPPDAPLLAQRVHARAALSGTGSSPLEEPVELLVRKAGAETVIARIAPVLLRIAGIRGYVPVTVLQEMTGPAACRDAFEFASFLLRMRDGIEGQEVAFVHESIAESLRATWPDAYRAVCRQMVWWALETLRHSVPTHAAIPIAQLGLWQWVHEAQSTPPALRRAACDAMSRSLANGSIPPLRALGIVNRWFDTMAPLGLHEFANMRAEDLMDLFLRRIELLEAAGAWHEAWNMAGQAVSHANEMIRDGNTAFRMRLARALSLRAAAGLRRQMAASAVEDTRRALDLYENEQMYPERPVEEIRVAETRWLLARALSVTDGAAPAVAAGEQALRLFRTLGAADSIPAVLEDLAALYVRTGRPEEADTCCSLAFDTREGRQAERASALSRRALVRSTLGNDRAALADMARAVQLYHDLLEAGRLDLAGEAAQVCFDQAMMSASAGKGKAAVESFTSCITLCRQVIEDQLQPSCRPLLARAHNQRGLLRIRQGDLEGAVHDYTQAVDLGGILLERERRSHLRSELAQARNNRALTFASMGRMDDALRDYQSAIGHYEVLIVRQQRPEFRHHLSLVYYNRGGLFRLRGDTASARRDYSRAIELLAALQVEQDSPDLRRDLSAAFTNRGLAAGISEEPEAALLDFERAITFLSELVGAGRDDVRGDLAAAHHGMGQAQARLKRWESAVRHFDAAIELIPDTPPQDALSVAIGASMDRGFARLALAACSGAAQDFERSLVLCWGLPLDGAESMAAALTGAGRALHGLGATGRARTAMNEAIELLKSIPKNRRRAAWLESYASARRFRALIRLEEEGTEAALEDLNEAIALSAAEGALQSWGAWTVELHLTRGRVEREEHRYEEAIKDATTAIDMLAQLALDREDGARLMAEATALRGRAALDLNRAQDALGDFTSSIDAYHRLVEETKRVGYWIELSNLYRSRGAVYWSAGARREAICDHGWVIDLLREVISRHDRPDLIPELAKGWTVHGYALMETGRHEEAICSLKEALRLGARDERLRTAIRSCERAVSQKEECQSC